MNTGDQIPDEVRAAIDTFLNECRKEVRPFVVAEAPGAIRHLFPALDIASSKLVNAMAHAAAAVGFGTEVLEEESEALDPGSMHHQYGRRIEADGSWTIYHVFTGTPARICGHSMSGLSRPGATEIMTFLNIRNEALRRGGD